MIRDYVDEDRDAVYPLRRTAFAGPRISPQWTVDPGGWYGFIAEDDGEIAGFLRVREFGQFFGGRSVPMGGVSSVAVWPHQRGKGIASQLLHTAITEMRERGQAISALFGAVPQLYRMNGWEHCGVRQFVTLSPEFLGAVGKSDVGLRAAQGADVEDIRATYLTNATRIDGMLTSAVYRPGNVLKSDICTVVEGGRGYLTANRDADDRLDVRELVAADADAGRALLRSLGSWAGQVREITLPVVDSALHDLVLGWPEHHQLKTAAWMLRVIDIEAAIAARGWPAAAALRPASVDIEVHDPIAGWQSGRYRLVLDTEVHIERGGTGALRFSPRGLAAWYSGTARMDALRRNGLITGPPEHDALLDALTNTGRQPRMSDDF